MNTFEKIYACLAIVIALAIITALIVSPELRHLKPLMTICLGGFIVNIGLMYLVLKDILSRPFTDKNRRYFWMAMVLLFWPSILYYLPKYGFRPHC